MGPRVLAKLSKIYWTDESPGFNLFNGHNDFTLLNVIVDSKAIRRNRDGCRDTRGKLGVSMGYKYGRISPQS